MRRGEPPVRGEIARGDRDGLREEHDRLGTLPLSREAGRTVTEGEQGGGDVLERDLGHREAAVRLGVAVFLGELAVDLFGLPELPGRTEPYRGVERCPRRAPSLQRMRAGRGRLGSGTEPCDPQAEFRRPFGVHDPSGRDPRALGQRR